MDTVITYKEISDFIQNELKIRPKFTIVDKKAFEYVALSDITFVWKKTLPM